MKTKIKYISCFAAFIFFVAASCKKDNYAPPKSKFQGAIMYKGDSIRVSYNDVTFQLWQSGFGKLTPIDVTVAQDGSYSALLFSGDYKLIIPAGQGPFLSLTNPKTNSDTILVHLEGDQTLDIQVLPYYMVKEPQFSISGKTVTATCKLQKIITDEKAKDVQSISLYISKTNFVDARNSISTATINGADITDMNNISLSTNVPETTPEQDYIFARIGVKINDVEDMIFSKIVKIQLK